MMNAQFTVFLSASVFVCASCDSQQKADSRIAIDVYVPAKSKHVEFDGTFATDPLDVYLDGAFVGTTPVVFTATDMRRFVLPADERIDVSSTEHWNTWDSAGDGTLVISNRDRSVKKRLEFRTRDRSSPKVVHFGPLAKTQDEAGGIVWLAGFPQTGLAERVSDDQLPSRAGSKAE